MLDFSKPKTCTIDYFALDDGAKLRYAHLTPTNPQNTLLILPGKSEFIEKYYHFALKWQNLGYQIFILDWRNQGLSSNTTEDPHKYHFTSTDLYLKDLKSFYDKTIKPQCKGHFITYAHSMGAHLTLRAIQEKIFKPDGQIFASPLFGLNYGIFPRFFVDFVIWLKARASKLSDYALTQGPWKPLPTSFQMLTNDKKAYEYHNDFLRKTPAFQSGGATFGWVKAIEDSSEALSQKAKTLTSPTLLLCPENDRIISMKAVHETAQKLQLNRQDQYFIHGAMHELHFETEEIQQMVWKKIEDWLIRHYNAVSRGGIIKPNHKIK